MSFYHVLTSNVAPETFPNNCASNFSTPIHNPYDFSGQWEVGLTQMTHSNCVSTFNNESYTIDDSILNKEYFGQLKTHLKFELSLPKKKMTRDEFNTEIKNCISQHSVLKHILEIRVVSATKGVFWKVLNPDIFVLISRDLHLATFTYGGVMTAEDKWPSGTRDMQYDAVLLRRPYIIIGTKTFNAEHYIVKEKNTEMSSQDLVQAFNAKVPRNIADILTLTQKGQFALRKLQNDGVILQFNAALNSVFHFNHASFFHKDKVTFSFHSRPLSYADAWIVSLIRLKVEPFTTTAMTYHLTNNQFTTQEEACNYLSSLDKRVTFTCDEQNIAQMEIHNKFVTVTLDNDLRDILAFDKNTYRGPGTFKASGILSLSRRIHYLYVYSNINKYIRIGDTEAPLLAVLPFDGSTCVPHIERAFKYPMYVPLMRNNIAQINIEIRDDTGQLVPFTKEALTTLRLHFRQVYANV